MRTMLTLQVKGVDLKPHFCRYARSGMGAAVRVTGFEEHIVLEIIVMEDDHDDPFTILMHEDKKVSTRTLVRGMSEKTVKFIEPKVA